MKIAFIGQKGIPSISGGVEKHVEDLSSELVKLGHEVFVYTRPNYTDKNLREFNGANLINIKSINSKHLDAISHTFFACLDAIFKRNFDVIHFHSIGPSSMIWLIKIFKPRTPVITTFHTQCYHHQKWGVFARNCLKFGEYIACIMADRVITVSKTLNKYTRDKYKTPAQYIPNGVRISESISAQKIREKWNLEKDSYIVLVSRLIKHKGIHYAIEAYNKIKTDKKLVIVGDGFHTNDYVNELKEKAQGNKNIIFTGSQSNQALKELFSNAYLFVQPSESEGLSIALLEALSFGKAVLVSNIPENKEVVENIGTIFKNKDISNLREKLEYLIKNPEIVKEYSQLGREHVKRNYNWEDIADNVQKLYKEARHEKNIKKHLFQKVGKQLY